MSKKYCIFLTALFCAFIGLFLVANAAMPDRDFSQQENRPLQQMPALSAKALVSGKFMKEFETYVTDQFVLRDEWIALKSTTERAVGKKENNSVFFGAQDTLLARFDQPDEARLSGNLDYVSQFAQKAGVPVYFSLIPGPATIWADCLPTGAPNYDQKQIIDRAATAAGATWFDSYTPLWTHRTEDIFYRTDHHWTSLGAYYGYTALAEAMGLTPVPLSAYTKTTVSEEFYGTVFSSSGVRWVKPDTMDTYVPDTGITVTSYTYDNKGLPVEEPRALYVKSFLDLKDKYSMFLGGQQPLGVVRTQNSDAPKLLLVRDSYTDSMVPFLTPHFSEIHVVDLRYYKLSISDYIAKNGIDSAVVLYSVPNFSSDSNLVWLPK